MLNKKLLPLLIAPLLLTGCDAYMAKPADYNTRLVDTASGEALKAEVVNNINSVIYDAKWDDGSASTKVLEQVLLQISESIIGKFYKTTTADPVSLAVANFKAEAALAVNPFVGDADVDTFINLHPIYWVKDASTNVRKTDETSKKREYQRVCNQYLSIEKRIAKIMYSKVNGGTYNINGRFYESKFLMSLINTNSKVANPSLLGSPAICNDGYLFVPEDKDYEVFTKNILHIENYQNTVHGFTYIEDSVLPGVYKDILTEKYVYTKAYENLGRSYGRKVNVISVAVDDKNPLFASNLVKEFAAKYINWDDDTKKPFGDVADYFNVLNIALRGYASANQQIAWEKATELLEVASGASQSFTLDQEIFGSMKGQSLSYYKGTSYGKLVEKTTKINDNSIKSNSSYESEFLGSGETIHSFKIGYDSLVDGILQENYVKDGWYIKNGGLSDLPETIRTRLFSVGVSNILDTDKATDRFTKDAQGTSYTYEIPDNEKYVALIHGNYYLVPSQKERPVGDEKINDFCWYDESSKKYYIINIEQAVSASKLSVTSDRDNYISIYGEEKGWNMMEEFSHEIADILAYDGSTYNTIATKYWLNYASMTFHDDVIKEYFHSNYPDLY